MRKLQELMWLIMRLAMGAAASYLFFIIIPLLHEMFGFHLEKSDSSSKMVVAELTFKQPPPEEKKEPPRARPIRSSTPQSGRGGSSSRSMRFSPDLSADAGPGGGEGVAMQTQELSAEVFEEGQTDEEPVAVTPMNVSYPDRLRDMGVEGEFVAIVVINHAGRVAAIDVVKSPHPALTSEMRRTMGAWRFKPAKNKGVPVSVKKRVTFTFSIDR